MPTQENRKRTSYPKICLSCNSLPELRKESKSCQHCKHTGCPEEKAASRQLCFKHLRQESANSTKRGRKKARTEQLLGIISPHTAPAVQWWGKTNDEFKEIALEFLRTCSSVQTNKKPENYTPTGLDVSKANVALLPPHRYKKVQFYNDYLLRKFMHTHGKGRTPTMIRNLADGENGVNIAICCPFGEGHFLDTIAKETIKLIEGKTQFEGAANIAASRPKSVDSPFLFTFGAVALHIQDEAEAQKRAHRTSAYYPHTDKFGSVALFLQLDGISFTFVALPGGATDEVKFDEDSDHFLRYKQWKAHASMEDSIALYQFERDFKQRAKQRRQMRVQVYELLAGQRLCFAAGQYLHASIIPAQVKGTLRSLLIFHDLEPI
jgi:hypothetical protein